MRTFLTLLIVICSFHTVIAQDESQEAMMGMGIALHNKADYAGAISTFDQVIQQDENFYRAYEEKALSLFYSTQYAECINWCEKTLKKFKKDKVERGLYITYGSALDAEKKPEEAIKVYNSGIKKFPEAYLLYFNRGVTEYLMKKNDEATEDFQTAVTLNPAHASSHQFLGYCMYGKNKIAAVMSLVTFLIIEPKGDRAVKNLRILQEMLGENVTKQDNNNISISLPGSALAKTTRNDDFHLAELAMTLSSALDKGAEHKDLSVSEKLEHKLELLPQGNNKTAKGFFTRYYVPFFTQMRKDSLTAAASNIIVYSGDEANVKKWIGEHPNKLEEFYKWFNGYSWIK